MNKVIKKAFSLIELIIVIAVIAVLTSVSVVVYFSVTDSSNNVLLIEEANKFNKALIAELEINKSYTNSENSITMSKSKIEINGINNDIFLFNILKEPYGGWSYQAYLNKKDDTYYAFSDCIVEPVLLSLYGSYENKDNYEYKVYIDSSVKENNYVTYFIFYGVKLNKYLFISANGTISNVYNLEENSNIQSDNLYIENYVKEQAKLYRDAFVWYVKYNNYDTYNVKLINLEGNPVGQGIIDQSKNDNYPYIYIEHEIYDKENNVFKYGRAKAEYEKVYNQLSEEEIDNFNNVNNLTFNYNLNDIEYYPFYRVSKNDETLEVFEAHESDFYYLSFSTGMPGGWPFGYEMASYIYFYKELKSKLSNNNPLIKTINIKNNENISNINYYDINVKYPGSLYIRSEMVDGWSVSYYLIEINENCVNIPGIEAFDNVENNPNYNSEYNFINCYELKGFYYNDPTYFNYQVYIDFSLINFDDLNNDDGLIVNKRVEE